MKKVLVFKVLCVVLIVLGFVISLVSPFAGGFIILGSILCIFFANKIFKKKESTGNNSTNKESTSVVFQTPSPVISHDAEIEAFNAELSAIPRAEIVRGKASCKRRNPDTMPGVHLTNITRRTNMEKFFPIIVLDTETTGFSAEKNGIIELSAIKLGPGFVPESCFTTLINPGRKIPPEAEAVHHISNEMVADAPKFSEIAASFSEYISDCKIVGHNVKFDLEFLYAEGLDIPSTVKYYDTLDLAKKTLISEGKHLYNPDTGKYERAEEFDVVNYKLPTLCEYYGVYRNDAHRSLSDCLATAKVLKGLVRDKTS